MLKIATEDMRLQALGSYDNLSSKTRKATN